MSTHLLLFSVLQPSFYLRVFIFSLLAIGGVACTRHDVRVVDGGKLRVAEDVVDYHVVLTNRGIPVVHPFQTATRSVGLRLEAPVGVNIRIEQFRVDVNAVRKLMSQLSSGDDELLGTTRLTEGEFVRRYVVGLQPTIVIVCVEDRRAPSVYESESAELFDVRPFLPTSALVVRPPNVMVDTGRRAIAVEEYRQREWEKALRTGRCDDLIRTRTTSKFEQPLTLHDVVNAVLFGPGPG
jgi:hypothetical protein